MLTRKRFLFRVRRDPVCLGAGWDASFRGPDGAWSIVLWHSLPVPFHVQFGWSSRGWYTADSAEELVAQTFNDFAPGVQGAEFEDEWDRLSAEERETLA